MKNSDIITQLAVALPKYTDKFSTKANISNITRSGTTVTVTLSSGVDMKTGNVVTIQGTRVLNTVTTLTQVDGTALCTTTNIHDLTQGFNQNVVVQGANETEYNGTVTVGDIISQKTFEYPVDSGASSPATGTITIAEDRYLGYNGQHSITKISATQFSYEIDANLAVVIGDPYFDANSAALLNIRISGAATIDNIRKYYEEQPSINDWWLFSTLGPVTASKNTKIDSDAVYRIAEGQAFQLELNQDFSLFVFIPYRNEHVSMREEIDDLQDVRVAIYKALTNVRFPSGFVSDSNNKGQYAAIPLGDQQFEDGFNGAFYVHEFDFQTVFNVVSGNQSDNNGDISPVDDTVAFREFQIEEINDNSVVVRTLTGEVF